MLGTTSKARRHFPSTHVFTKGRAARQGGKVILSVKESLFFRKISTLWGPYPKGSQGQGELSRHLLRLPFR